MTSELKILARISISAACGDGNELKRISRSASFRRVSQRKMVEALLQLHLFAGFPATIEAFSILALHLGKAPRQKSGSDGHTRTQKKSLGMAAFRRVYADRASEVIHTMIKLHPYLSTWILEHGYGTVLSRRGLSLQEREVCAIAVLASLGWTTQLKSHMRGAVNLGVRSTVIEEAYRMGSERVFRRQKSTAGKRRITLS